jgi:leucyl aminopeptidase (aminopeptidase T)
MMTAESMALPQIMQSAEMLLRHCVQVKRGEQVLIIADTASDFAVVSAMQCTAAVLGAEPTFVVMMPRNKTGEEPSEVVSKAIWGSDVVFAVASTSVTHTRAIQAALDDKRIRFISMPAVNTDLMTRGAATADYKQVEQTGQRLLDSLVAGSEIKVTSDLGTNLTASIAGRPYKLGVPFVREPGQMSTFPGGEVWKGLVSGSAQGVVVIDTSMHMLGLLSDHIRYTVRNGKVVKVDGEKEAKRLLDILENVPNWENIAEIAIGINPKARITGNVSEDKKGLGRVHVALGDDIIYGGTVESPVHLDGVIDKPQVYIDGKLVMDKGVMMV